MRIKKLWRQLLLRRRTKQIEIKKALIKSVVYNKNIDNHKRGYAYIKKTLLIRDRYKNQVQRCTISGKARGVWRFCGLGRHKLNEINKVGGIVNIATSSW